MLARPKHARILALPLMAAVLCGAEAQRGPSEPFWLLDPIEASARARDTARPVLAFFTDSAACPWCAKLVRDVFDTPEFRRWAGENAVPLMLDFPTGQPQDEATRQRNEAMKKKHGVRGYPMVVFLSPEEKELGRIPGYPQPAATPEEARDRWLKLARAIIARGPGKAAE